MAMADAMIVLQAEGLNELAPALRAKTRVIHQSVHPVIRRDPPSTYVLITVIGHLRDEKDPLRAALALPHLPEGSRIRVVQLGASMDPALEEAARRISATDPRYRWLGEVAHGDAMRWLARSHAMVISSRMEGGAHVVSEAIGCGVPVLASHIPGPIGLLGSDYPGYYRLEDEQDLAGLMARVESDRRFVLSLERGVSRRRHLIDAEAERAALASLVRDTVQRVAR
jgi:glycosyltransferase involved in cell wall biosynthesis